MRLTIDLNVNVKQVQESELLKLLKIIINQNNTTVAKIDDVNAKLATLQQTVDEEQQEVANALAALQTEVQTLKDIIAAGSAATEEQLQEVVDNIDGIISDIKTTIPNLPPPEEPTEPTDNPTG